MARRPISLQQEERIWTLRCLGYRYDAIAVAVGVAPSSLTRVLRRARRRRSPCPAPAAGAVLRFANRLLAPPARPLLPLHRHAHPR